jgi:hypothetical protein
MDPDSKHVQKQLNDLEISIFKQRSYSVSNVSNVFQPSGVRCIIQNDNGLDRFLLDYGFNFLPISGIISWFIFLIS